MIRLEDYKYNLCDESEKAVTYKVKKWKKEIKNNDKFPLSKINNKLVITINEVYNENKTMFEISISGQVSNGTWIELNIDNVLKLTGNQLKRIEYHLLEQWKSSYLFMEKY